MANPQRILTYLTASKDTLFQEKITVVGQTNLNGIVNLGDASSDIITAAGQVTASVGIEGRLYGTSSYALDSDLLDGKDSSLYALKADVTGAVANFSTRTEVSGAITGALTPYALSSDVSSSFITYTEVTNSLPRLSADNTFTGQMTASAGLYVNGGLSVNGDLTYINTTNLNVTDRKITIADGASDVNASGPAGIYLGSDTSPIGSFYATGSTVGWHISGAAGLFVAATSSADLTNIGSGIVANGEFNVEAALRAIDSAFAAATSITTVRTEYDKLRFLQTGSITNAAPVVVSLAKDAFLNSRKNFITLDVMIRDDVNNPWTNDLVSVYMQTGSTYVDVTIDAPGVGASGWEYKLVAINDNTGSLGLI